MRKSFVLAINVNLVCASVICAWALRFEFHLRDAQLLFSVIPLLVLYRLAAMGRFGLLHGYWRHTSVNEAVEMCKALMLSSAAFLVTVRYILGIGAFPLSVYCIDLVVATLLLQGVRLGYRAAAMQQRTIDAGPNRRKKQRVLVIGAGFAAQMLIRELTHADSEWTVSGCVDDDRHKIGSKIHGVSVLGSIQELGELSAEHRTFEVLIAIPSATAAQMRRIVKICHDAGLKYQTVPGLRELVTGEASVRQLREVRVEDLLGREPVRLDIEPVRRKVRDTAVLVSGAAGSIGSELVFQILQSSPSVLVCVDHDESALFELEHRLKAVSNNCKIEFCVADVNNTDRMESILSRFGINSVFHAAAYKHVPLMESNVSEAVRNNVFGLISMLEAADKCNCSSFVLISSDKAVNPTSFMGCTKRLGELILAARQTSKMRCVTVRFGNVLGSQGSVVPLFQQQIRTTRKITVTHPDITRYFMTIGEAVALVLQAFVIAEDRDLLVLDMGKPIPIVDLARTLIKLSDVPERQVEIVYTGLRPGEKLFEELFYKSEEQNATSVGRITRAKSSTIDWSTLSWHLTALRTLAAKEAETDIRVRMKQIIPEYFYPGLPGTVEDVSLLQVSAVPGD
jgi:FlaA1/EpsC-like NDP-sugar epimerase